MVVYPPAPFNSNTHHWYYNALIFDPAGSFPNGSPDGDDLFPCTIGNTHQWSHHVLTFYPCAGSFPNGSPNRGLFTPTHRL